MNTVTEKTTISITRQVKEELDLLKDFLGASNHSDALHTLIYRVNDLSGELKSLKSAREKFTK